MFCGSLKKPADLHTNLPPDEWPGVVGGDGVPSVLGGSVRGGSVFGSFGFLVTFSVVGLLGLGVPVTCVSGMFTSGPFTGNTVDKFRLIVPNAYHCSTMN